MSSYMQTGCCCRALPDAAVSGWFGCCLARLSSLLSASLIIFVVFHLFFFFFFKRSETVQRLKTPLRANRHTYTNSFLFREIPRKRKKPKQTVVELPSGWRRYQMLPPIGARARRRWYFCGPKESKQKEREERKKKTRRYA